MNNQNNNNQFFPVQEVANDGSTRAFVPLHELAIKYGYTRDHLGLLARSGKIVAQKSPLGYWYADEASVLKHREVVKEQSLQIQSPVIESPAVAESVAEVVSTSTLPVGTDSNSSLLETETLVSPVLSHHDSPITTGLFKHIYTALALSVAAGGVFGSIFFINPTFIPTEVAALYDTAGAGFGEQVATLWSSHALIETATPTPIAVESAIYPLPLAEDAERLVTETTQRIHDIQYVTIAQTLSPEQLRNIENKLINTADLHLNSYTGSLAALTAEIARIKGSIGAAAQAPIVNFPQSATNNVANFNGGQFDQDLTVVGDVNARRNLRVNNQAYIASDTTIGGDLTTNGDATFGGSVSLGGSVLYIDALNSRVGIGTTAPQTSLHIAATDALVIPVGTTVQRTSVQGAIRYNSTITAFEGYNGSNWTGLGGVIDVDRDTFIIPEATPGSDEDALNFYTAGTEKLRLTTAGGLNLYGSNPVIDLASASSTLEINTTTNRPVTFGTGTVTIPNLSVTNSQTGAGTFDLDSNATTETIFSVTGTSLTSGTAISKTLTANAGNGQITHGEIVNLTDSTTAGGGFTGIGISVTGSGTGSGNKYLLDLNPNTANNEVVFDNNGAFRPTQSVASNTATIGSPSYYWKNGYFDQITANNIAGVVVSGATSSTTWTIGSTQTGDVNEAIIFQRNSGSGNATLQWNAGSNDLRYLTANYPLNSTYTVDDSSIGTGINQLSANLTNNTTSGTQKLLSLSNTGTGTTENGLYISNTGTLTTAIELNGTYNKALIIPSGSGNVGIGTTSPTAVTDIQGTGKALYVTSTGSTLATNGTEQFFKVTGTLPATFQNGAATEIDITSAGNPGGFQLAFSANLLAGYTGTSASGAVNASNAAAGTGNNLRLSTSTGQPFGNYALYGVTYGTTTGANYGLFTEASNGDRNFAVLGKALVAKNSGINVGVAGFGLNSGTSAIQIGGYFGLQNATPSFESGALIADNGGTTSPIFLARDNGSTVFSVTDGGTVGIGTTNPTRTLDIEYAQTTGYGGIQLNNTASGGHSWGLTVAATGDTESVAAGSLYLRSDTSGGAKFVLNTSGNVGIGTTSPGAKLDIVQGSNALGLQLVANANTSANAVSISSNTLASTALVNLAVSGTAAASNGQSVLNLSTSGSNATASQTTYGLIISNTHAGSDSTNIGADITVSNGTNDNIGLRINAASGQDAFMINNSSVANRGWIFFNTTNGSASDLGIYERSGGQRLTFQAGGNVGIGSTTPAAKLDIVGTAGNNAIANFASASGTSALYVSKSGNVGMGTAIPGKLLHVYQSSNTAVVAGVNNPNSGTAANSEWRVGENITTANTSYITLAYLNSGFTASGEAVPNLGSLGTGSSATNGLRIFTNAAAPIKFSPNGTEALRIASGGNVGIGSTTPTAKLDVVGTAGANAIANFASASGTSALYVSKGGNVGVSTTSPVAKLDIFDNTSANLSSFKIKNGSAQDVFSVDNNGRTYIGSSAANTYASNDYALYVNYTDKNTYFAAGNVGIGSATPSARLSVVGTAGNNAIANFASASGTAVLTVAKTGQVGVFGDFNSGVNGTTDAKKLYVGNYDNDGVRMYPIYVEDENNFVDFYLRNASSAGGIPEAYFRGNVGIGTTTANNKLTVTGGADFSGNVGIGSTAPVVPLDVYRNVGQTSGQNELARFYDTSTSGVALGYRSNGSSGIGGYIRALASQPLYLETTGAPQALTILNAGNVGIGTTNPTLGLEVAGSAYFGRSDSSDYMRIGRYSAADPYAYISARQSPSSGGTAGFKIEVYSSGAATTALTVMSGGNIGIGTTTANNKLTVTGAADFSGNVGIGTTSATVPLTIRTSSLVPVTMTGTTDSYLYTLLTNGTAKLYTAVEGPSAGSVFTGSLAYAALIGTDVAGKALQFVTSSIARQTIDSTGNVGIGSTAPSSWFNIAGTRSGSAADGNPSILTIDGGSYAGLVKLGSSASHTGRIALTGAGTENLVLTGSGTAVLSDSLTIGNGGTAITANGNNTDDLIMATGSAYNLVAIGGGGNHYGRVSIKSGGVETVSLNGYGVSYFNTGNVGIGTTNPAALLTVGSGTPSTAANGLNFGTDTSANLYRSASATIKTDGSLFVAVNATAVKYLFNGNAAVPTDSTATVFDQGSVGPTISGLGFEVRTGGTPAQRLSISSTGTATFTGPIVTTDNVTGTSKITTGGNVSFAAAGVSGILESGHTVTLTGPNPTTYATFFAHQIGSLNLGGTNDMQTVTDAAGLAVLLPTSASNNRITNNHGILVQATTLNSQVTVAGYGLTVNAPTGAAANYAAEFLGGNVGIGTTSPAASLHVVGTAGNNAIANFASASGTSVLRIAKDGNVGIGTTSPLALFHTSLSSANKPIFYGDSTPTYPRIIQNLSASTTTDGSTTATSRVIGLNLENASQTDSVFSPLITFSRRSAAGNDSTIFASVGGYAVGTGVDTNYVKGDLVFATRGGGTALVERMRVDNAGNVGIGSTAPTSILDIQAASGIAKLTSSTGTNGASYRVTNTGGTTYLGIENSAGSGIISGTSAYDTYLNAAASSSNIQLAINGTIKMTIPASGNVVTTGGLTASGGINAKGAITATATGSANNGGTLSMLVDDVNSVTYLYSSYWTTEKPIVLGTYSNVAAGGNGGGALNTPQMYLGTNSRVGIGTSAPGSKLSIVGSLSLGSSTFAANPAPSEGIIVSGNVGIGTLTPAARLSVSTDGVRNINFVGPGSSSAGSILGDSANGMNIGVSGAGPLSLFTTNTARVTVDAGGNVGIGTTAPATKFEVQGTASASYGLFGTLQIGGFSSVSYNRFGTSTTGHSNYISSSNDVLVSGDFETVGSVSLGNNALTVAATGNVGIGTTSPSAMLNLFKLLGNDVGIKLAQNQSSIWNIKNEATTGNLVFDNNGGQLFVMDPNGNVGIGTSTMAGRLRLYSSRNVTTDSYGINISNGDVNTTTDAINKYGAYISSNNPFTGSAGTATNNWGLYVDTAAGADNNYGAYIAGNVGIGTTNPSVLATVYSTSDTNILRLRDSSGTCDHNPDSGSETVSCSSDARLKTNVRNTTSALSYLHDLVVKDYTVLASGKEATGLIAQEALITHPELVTLGDDGYYKVAQINTWKLVKGLQELDERTQATYYATDVTAGEIASFDTATSGTVEQATNVTEPIGVVANVDAVHFQVQVALNGVANIKVSSENGAIRAGDHLTMSTATPGVAMKATVAGSVVGTALQDFDGSVPLSTISAFVQVSYWAPSVTAVTELTPDVTIATAGNFTLGNLFDYILEQFQSIGITIHDGVIQLTEIITNKVTTKQLCVEATCINEDQLKALLQSAAVPTAAPASPTPTPEVTPEVTPTPSETPDPEVSPTPTPEITETPSPTPEPTETPTPTPAPTETPAPEVTP